MKKEYIILGLIIIALSAYILTNKTDRDNYTLPSIPEINGSDITEITVQKGDKNIVISKNGGSWSVANAGSDKSYKANQESITKMVDLIKSLKLSALVSESGNLSPYELDEKNRITVEAKSQSETVRKFEIGKSAPSFRHTFVRLDANKSIYHAEKSFRQDFDKSLQDLRDKKIISFDKGKISAITIKKGDKIKEFAIKDGKPVSSGEVKEAIEEGEAIETILTTLSDLNCHSFTDSDNKDEFRQKEILEIAKITLKEEPEKELSFVIYTKDENDNYPAISSESIYPFFITTHDGNQIVEKIDSALGIKKEEPTSEDKQESQ
ncbi:MAG: DUF4340 domain-containing protein [Desulfamplus sp.]|nr:DUF4340 domain-containing protein [Desulfamplus sp.]